jgi:hypothetical protein
MSWSTGTSYRVYRGSITGGSPFSYGHVCEASGLQAESYTDSDTPDEGDALYYLVVAVESSTGGPIGLGNGCLREHSQVCP